MPQSTQSESCCTCKREALMMPGGEIYDAALLDKHCPEHGRPTEVELENRKAWGLDP